MKAKLIIEDENEIDWDELWTRKMDKKGDCNIAPETKFSFLHMKSNTIPVPKEKPYKKILSGL